MILHADGNSFYASCEQVYRPDLRGKPVVVLSNNDGIIIALNKEAKACNLQRGDVFFKVKNICESKNVAVFSSNYTLYADISRRITSIYLEYSPEIEEYSIDESFLFFNNCNWSCKEYEQIGFELKYRIGHEVGIPICVGAAPTKTLAKLYNKNAKSHNGVYVYKPEEVDSLLESTPCDKIWGIGPSRAKTLFLNGITNGLELKHMPLYDANKLLTCQGFSTVQELNGIACIDKVDREKKDIITSSRQFGRKVYTIEELECAVAQYTQSAVEKMRAQNCDAGGVYVYISTCNYYSQDDASKYANGALVQFPRHTSYTPDIVNGAIGGLQSIFRSGYGYKTVMITLVNLKPEAMQGWLWIDPMEDIKKRNFMRCIDQVSSQWGRSALIMAKGLPTSEWGMKREYLSPCYTTNIADIPKIR